MATTKEVNQVFGRWIAWQRVYQRRDVTSFMEHINQAYWDNLVSECDKNEVLHKNISHLFEVDSQNKVIINGKFKMHKVLALIETDISAFLRHLKSHHLFDGAPLQPLSNDEVFIILDQYIKLMNALFYHQDKFIQSEYLFSVGIRFFEYCFADESHDEFFAMLNNEPDYPLARFIQSVLWQYLSAEGWRDWHEDSLAFLKKESEAGKTIVYVAGGIDVYQLLKQGIYNIEVIDPLLPSQAADYYAEGWSWLIDGNIGDEINMTDDVVLRRHSYESFDTFQAITASGETVEITRAHIAWLVCDRRSGQTIGSLVFKRRFALQSDFVLYPTKTLLTSFNEMYLLSAPSYCGGWGIEAEPLLDDMTIVVKQLRKPVTATHLKRLTRANDVPFRFVNLGGCAT